MGRLLLLLTWLIIASIFSVQAVQVSEANCLIKSKCRRFKGDCQTTVCNEDEGEWAVPNGCRATGQTTPADCNCCTSHCRRKAWCTKRAGKCIKTNVCNNGRLNPNGCNGPDCACCVKPKDVQASFKLTNEEYSEELRNHSSAKYIELKTKVEKNFDSVIQNNAKISGFQVEFFRNGTVMVDVKVSTTEEIQKKANDMVLKALINSGVIGLDKNSVTVGVRLCVPARDKCTMMKDDISNLPIICIEARDRYDCLQRLKNEEVDVVRGDAADVYLAYDLYRDDLKVAANIKPKNKENKPYLYRFTTVVRISTINALKDLNGSKSCHAGTHTFCSTDAPISKLIRDGIMHTNCSSEASVVENELRTISSYFGEACIPHKWVPDVEIDARLKKTYSNLCSLCDNPTECDKNDLYSGHDGALNCLINSSADVAWTVYDAVDKFFKDNEALKEHFGILCPDGKIEKMTDLNPDSCYWAAIPWPAWIVRKGDKNAIVPVLTRVMEAAADGDSGIKDWAKDVLGIEERSIIQRLKPAVTPYKYINQAGYDKPISEVVCEADNVRLCVDPKSEQKCNALAEVLKSRKVRPHITCVVQADEGKCVEAIASDKADIITLDGGDMFKAYSDHELIPVISEVYGDSHVSYYAVAVVHAGSDINSLADLQGKKSCHTGINKSAGWKVPLITLLNAGLLKRDECNYTRQMESFFSKSCAPGASTDYPSLCDLCIGDQDGNHKCEKKAEERYSGYAGAFRCLAEAAGDVAFIKHTTVPGNTDGNSTKNWTLSLPSSDFKLLCKDNTTRDVEDYKSCYLATVPSHKVVTRNNASDVLKEEIRILLLRASETLHVDQDAFVLFGDYGIDHDLLFKSSTTGLQNLPEDEFLNLKEEPYWQVLTELEKCETA